MIPRASAQSAQASPLPLAGWALFCRLPMEFDLRSIGIMQTRGDVNRFRARFRAASSFRGLNLEGFSPSTSRGYASFCRVLFVYSAFESFLRLIGKEPWEVGSLLEEHGSIDTLSNLRALDSDHSFYEFIHERVNNRLKKELEEFIQMNPCSVGLLAGAIRHLFAHGHLTPNAAGGSPARATKICDIVSDFLLRFMSAEFGAMVKRSTLPK